MDFIRGRKGSSLLSSLNFFIFFFYLNFNFLMEGAKIIIISILDYTFKTEIADKEDSLRSVSVCLFRV